MALFAPSTVEFLHDLWIENIDMFLFQLSPGFPNWENACKMPRFLFLLEGEMEYLYFANAQPLAIRNPLYIKQKPHLY